MICTPILSGNIYLCNDLFEVFDHLNDFHFRFFNRFGMPAQIPFFPFFQFPAPEFLYQLTHLSDNFGPCSLGVLICQIDELLVKRILSLDRNGNLC